MNKHSIRGKISLNKYKHVLKIMKITLFFLFFCIMVSNATNTYSQGAKINLKLNSTTIEKAFREVEKKSEYKFVFAGNIKHSIINKKVSININTKDIGKIIEAILVNTNLSYTILDKQVAIYKSEIDNVTTEIEQPVTSTILQQPEKIKVTGKIVDEKGEAIIGANVIEKGKPGNGTITDINGNFTLFVQHDATIVVTYIGYSTREKKVEGKTVINITLDEDTQSLDEVIVTGYQKIDRRLFTGAADVVKGEDAKIDGVTDVSRMLQGKSAGVQITNVSGTFGASPKIRVRGASSIYGNQNPLWVVDGVVLEDVVELSADDLSSGNAATLISSAVAGLNADDIASFQILKDASATALYGARAMNGVVVITTKEGRTGKTRINYTGEFTTRTIPRYSQYNLMNSVEQMSVYREMDNKGWLNYADVSRRENGGEFLRMYKLIDTYYPEKDAYGLINDQAHIDAYLRLGETANTNWFDELFQHSLQMNHSVSMATGNNKTKTYASLSFFTDPGWTKIDNVKRFTANVNISHDFNEKFNVKFQTSNSLRIQKVPGTQDRKANVVEGEFSRDFDINPFSYALNTSRTMRAKDHTGNLIWYQMNFAPFNILNEMENNYIDLDMLDIKLQGELNYKPIKGLELKALGALRYVKSSQEAKVTESSNLANAYRAADDATIIEKNRFLFKDPDDLSQYPQVVMPLGGFYNTKDDRLLNYYMRTTANYNTILNEKHILNFMAGQEIKYADRLNRWNNGYGYQYDKGGTPFLDYRLMKQLVLAGFDYYGMGEKYDRFVAFFGTGSYSYKGWATMNLTGRYDGSNRLGKSRSARWLPTWNMSGAYNIHGHLMPTNKKVSTLNLRATYGLTASMGPARNSLPVFYSGKTFRPTQGENESLIYISSLENKDLTWEKQYEANLGVDIGFFNNRISLSMDAYQRKGFDLIGYVRTSAIGGELIKTANYADMKSHGIEFSLNTKNIVSKDFNYTTNITFAYNKNEITNLKSQPRVIDIIGSEGGPLEGYPVRGLFSIPFDGLNKDGLPTFKVKDGKTTIGGINFQERNDISWLKYEGSIDPKITGGLDNSFRYKNIKLNLYFTYQFGNKIRLYPYFSSSYSDMNAMPKEMKNRWSISGDEKQTNVPVIASLHQAKTVPNLKTAYNAYNYSSERVAKGDYFRLKEISLSYDINPSYLQNKGMNKLQFRLVTTNVWLIYSDKKLGGQDPEFFHSGGVAMPLPTQFTFSVRAGF